jgi:transposase, IS30 family
MPDVYLHVYANKAAGGDLYKSLHSQKPRRKRYLCGRDRRAQIPKRAA